MARYLYPGDISEYTIIVDGKDFSGIVQRTEIFQDLFMPNWSASLYFRDMQNWMMNMPIVPGSKVTITLGTEAPKHTGKTTFNFIIYKISERQLFKQQDYGYVVQCIDENFLVDSKTRLSKSYKNKNPKQIVSSIISEYLGYSPDKIDSDPTTYNIVLPNMSPHTAIEYVASFSKNPDAAADFVYYQSDHGKYSFRSVDKIFNEGAVLIVKQKTSNTREDPNKENEDSYVQIEKYRFNSQVDAVPNIVSGSFGNTLIVHDIVKKKWEEKTYTYSQDVSADSALKSWKKLDSGMEKSNIQYHNLHANINNGYTPNENYDVWRASRKWSLQKLDHNRLIVEMPGHLKYYDIIGKMIDFEMPSQQDLTDIKLDKYLKGKWLVAACRWVATPDSCKLIMELAKKRLEASL